MGKRVAVLMGGWGEEREISIRTGEQVAGALEQRGHRVHRVLAGPGLDQALRGAKVETAFLALHGRMGEDGKVQGLLEVIGLPYTGSGVLASALAMDKPMAKRLFHHANLPTAPGYACSSAFSSSDDALALHGDLGFPCVVKPARGGSSLGLAVVRAESELGPAVEEACRFGGSALVERLVRGREVTVAILGAGQGAQVLGSCEISHPGEAFDFTRKYQGGSAYHLPPRLSPTRVANIEALALAAYRELGCRGYGRVDLIASEDHNDVLLEVNTLPGMTPRSLFPKIARAAGVSFEELMDRILSLAALDEIEVRADRANRAPPPVRLAG